MLKSVNTAYRIFQFMQFLVVVVVAMLILSTQSKKKKVKESYRPVGADYRYALVDTNPVRRTGQFFDTCSPENMEDCSRNNPYEGLPLP